MEVGSMVGTKAWRGFSCVLRTKGHKNGPIFGQDVRNNRKFSKIPVKSDKKRKIGLQTEYFYGIILYNMFNVSESVAKERLHD